MKEEFVIAEANGAEIEVHCWVRGVSGNLDYHIRGDNIYGNMTFLSCWYPDIDSPPGGFVIASGERNANGKPRFHNGGHLSVNEHLVTFRYEGHREDHYPTKTWPNWQKPTTDGYRKGTPQRRCEQISHRAMAIAKQLVEMSLRRDDAEELHRIAELATAADRRKRDLERIEDHRLSIDILTRELAESEQRAEHLAAQAAEHKTLFDAYLIRVAQQREDRLAKYQQTQTATAPPTATATHGPSGRPRPKTTRRNPKT